MSLLVNSIFHSIQGEGPTMGVPSIFLRLLGCNLECIWCDTKFTWLFSDKTLKRLSLKDRYNEIGELKAYDKSSEGEDMSIEKIIKIIKGYPCKNIVITGGEPLLQEEGLKELIGELHGYSIEIETNGTLPPIEGLDQIRYNVSPKLRNSLNHREVTNSSILNQFRTINSIFKFVIDNNNDIEECLELITANRIQKNNVYLMAKASTQDQLRERALWLVDKCKVLNLNYSHRLHIELWGEVRDV